MEIETQISCTPSSGQFRESFPSRRIEQAYLSVGPAVSGVRRDGKSFYLTYKGIGLMVREEYNLPLTEASYLHLLAKADGAGITKQRYQIPYAPVDTVELDVFDGAYAGLILAEVEFPTEEEADRLHSASVVRPGSHLRWPLSQQLHGSGTPRNGPSNTDDEIKAVH